MDIPVAANILGVIGAVCWSVQLIPQIVVNYRRHHATGLQPSMMMLWAWAGVPLGVYNIIEEFNIALQIQPQILTLLSLLTWIQCFYYQRKWTVKRSLVVVTPIAVLMAGIQASLIIGLRLLRARHIEWPMTFMAVLSAVLLAAGVLRHYWDIWTHQTVRGISFLFVGIDAAGDLFSLLSLLFQPTLDKLGIVIYGTELLLWLGVFACGGWYNLLPWSRSQIADHFSRSRSIRMDVASPGEAGSNPPPLVALHEMPSSASVFRTASNDSTNLRSRTVISVQ